jgi:rhamnogalacturonyl hydrolase YesR
MLGHAEALESMAAWPAGYPDEVKNEQVRTIFKQHAEAFKMTQGDDGRWHQLLNDTQSFRETSVVSVRSGGSASAFVSAFQSSRCNLLNRPRWQSLASSEGCA